MRPDYVPLSVKSHFSLLEASSPPDELVETAHHLGLRKLVLCDRDSVSGAVRAWVKGRELGVAVAVGAEVTVCHRGLDADAVATDGRIALARLGEPAGSGLVSSIRLLAETREGYANLCRLLTLGRRRAPKGRCLVRWEEVAEAAGGLRAVWGGPGSLLRDGAAPPQEEASLLREAFGRRLVAMLDRHRRAEDLRAEATLRERAAAFELPLVAGGEVRYATPARRPLCDVLLAIRHRTTLDAAGRLLLANAEHDLKSPTAFAALYRSEPELVRRTLAIGEALEFEMGALRYRYPSEELPDGRTSMQHLRHLTFEGARARYDSFIPADVSAQLERELALIDELDYPGYFLTMSEIVGVCRERGILAQGRGSAANSAVCYCLGITAVDPVRMGLLFERFLSRERAEPPDIDLDVAHERREEVIAWVYERYGRDHAAMVANIIRYRGRSAVRDVGKALGLPETSLDRLARMVDHYDGPDATALERAGLDPEAPRHRWLMQIGQEIQDVPRHLSIHPGGFLLGHEPVWRLVPIENAAMPGRTVIQWDKEDVEALGLFKVDLLALGALSQLDRGFRMLRSHKAVEIDMARIPADDPLTYAMIRRADTVGVFQIESRAQMAMLPRLLPKTWYDLVIEVSIVRPGPITGGMVHPYLRRRAGEEPVTYPHPCLEPVLERTLGVPLFQEQVMKLAVVAADYTPGEADQLRRDMAAWRRSGRIEAHRERLVSRMVDKGIATEFAERVFEQIRGFGEYGFPESHAASFALISYAAAWMRAHHLDIFTAALLDAWPMGFYAPATLVDDASRRGIVFRPVDVCHSEDGSLLDPLAPDEVVAHPGFDPPSFAIRMGLRWVKGLREADRRRILAARARAPFHGIDDLMRRAGLGEDALVALAEAGALGSLESDRRRALWRVRGLLRDRQCSLPLDLEEPEVPTFAALGALDRIAWDYRAASHSTAGHPLAPLRPQLRAAGLPTAEELGRQRDGQRARFVGLVITRQRPGTAKGTTFLTLEDETGFVNVVLWSSVYEEHRVLARSASLLGVSGKVQAQRSEGAEVRVVHLVADGLFAPSLPSPPRPSRDFH
ncbi:MAG: error-prone DNA polymerase [Deltaproteobacteria bacterium]|nr:error-prone DNA polymerase [Deltaproteobacteria bacterium]